MQLAGLQEQLSEVLGRSDHERFVALDDNRQRAAGAPPPAAMLYYSEITNSQLANKIYFLRGDEQGTDVMLKGYQGENTAWLGFHICIAHVLDNREKMPSTSCKYKEFSKRSEH